MSKDDKKQINNYKGDPIDTRIIDDSPQAKGKTDRVRSNSFFTKAYEMLYESMLNKEDKNNLCKLPIKLGDKEGFLFYDIEKKSWFIKEGGSGGEKGLTKVYKVEKDDVKSGDIVRLDTDEDINRFVSVDGTILDSENIIKKREYVDRFKPESSKKFYENENIVFNNSIALKHNVEIPINPIEDYWGTPKFDYHPENEFTSLSFTDVFVAQLKQGNTTELQNGTVDSFQKPYKDLITYDSNSKFYEFAGYSTGPFNQQPWQHFIIDGNCYLGDFDVTFEKCAFAPEKYNPHPRDNDYPYYIRWGVCDIEDSTGIIDINAIDKNNSRGCGVIASFDDKNIQVNFDGESNNTKQVSDDTKKLSNYFKLRVIRKNNRITLNIQALDRNSGKVLHEYTSNGYDYKKPVYVFAELAVSNSDANDKIEFYKQEDRTFDLPPYAFIEENVAYTFSIDEHTKKMYIIPISHDWEKEPKKGEVLKTKANIYLAARSQTNNNIHGDNLQIVTGQQPNNEVIEINKPVVESAAIFMKEDYVMDFLDLEKFFVNYDLQKNIPQGYLDESVITLVFSTDQGKTWVTFDREKDDWKEVHIENVEDPTTSDIANVLTEGISVKEFDIVKFEKLPNRPFNKFRIGVALNAYMNQFPYLTTLETDGIKDRIWRPAIKSKELIGDDEDYGYTVHYEKQYIEIEFKKDLHKVKLYFSCVNKNIIK